MRCDVSVRVCLLYLDKVALTIDVAVDGSLHFSVTLGRDMGLSAVCSDPFDQRHGVIAPVCNNMVVAFRRHTLLPLDGCLYALQPSAPHLTRSSLHRCLQRHRISRLPDDTLHARAIEMLMCDFTLDLTALPAPRRLRPVQIWWHVSAIWWCWTTPT